MEHLFGCARLEKRVIAYGPGKLLRRAYDDGNAMAKARRDPLRDQLREPFQERSGRAENDIATLDVGADVSAAGLGEYDSQVLHRQQMLAADVDASE